MSDVKHTPGPWTACDFAAVVVPETHGYGTWVANARVGGASMPEQLANARLIAAAPELLEALKGMMAALDAYGDLSDPNRNDIEAMLNYAEAEKKARAAISKAQSR